MGHSLLFVLISNMPLRPFHPSWNPSAFAENTFQAMLTKQLGPQSGTTAWCDHSYHQSLFLVESQILLQSTTFPSARMWASGMSYTVASLKSQVCLCENKTTFSQSAIINNGSKTSPLKAVISIDQLMFSDVSLDSVRSSSRLLHCFSPQKAIINAERRTFIASWNTLQKAHTLNISVERFNGPGQFGNQNIEFGMVPDGARKVPTWSFTFNGQFVSLLHLQWDGRKIDAAPFRAVQFVRGLMF